MGDDFLESGRSHTSEGFTPSKVIRCHHESCKAPSTVFVEGRLFCLTHFISYCYERLEDCHAGSLRRTDAANADAEVRFLREACERAANLVPPVRGLDNLERARLFDIFLWASELLSQRGALDPSPNVAAQDPRRR